MVAEQCTQYPRLIWTPLTPTKAMVHFAPGEKQCCTYGFGAAPGWDAASGLGSPNFKALEALALNRQSMFPALGAFPNGGGPAAPTPAADSTDDRARLLATVALVLAAVLLAANAALAAFVVYKLKVKKATTQQSIQSI